MATGHPTHWYYIDSQTARGPLTLQQIRELVTQGKLTTDTLVCPAGEQTWTPAKNWAMLFPPRPPVTTASRPPVPPPPPPPPSIVPSVSSLPMAIEIPASQEGQTFAIVHWVFNGVIALLFIGATVYYTRDKPFNIQAFENIIFDFQFAWAVRAVQIVMTVALAWFLRPRVKWIVIGFIVVGFFSFLGSFAMSFEAFRQRRNQLS